MELEVDHLVSDVDEDDESDDEELSSVLEFGNCCIRGIFLVYYIFVTYI